MKENASLKARGTLLLVLASVVLAVAGILYYVTQPKWAPMVVGLGLIALVVFADWKPLKRIPVLLVLAYVVFMGLTGFWAMSGKFFLREYCKLFVACALFLTVVLWDNFGETTLRKFMGVLAGIGAVYALFNVEAATTGLFDNVLIALTGLTTGEMGFIGGSRLMGIFGNANISATIHALSLLMALALLQHAGEKKEKILYAVFAAFNAYALLLGFSMGGIACFAVSILVYLISAGKDRGGALLRMLEVAIPTMLFGFASFPFFNDGGVMGFVPMIFLLANGAVVAVLELKVAAKLTGVLEQRQKLVLVILAAVLAVAAAYVVVGYNMSGPYTFENSSLRRSAYPEAGAHVLNIEADGDVDVTIISQTMAEVMMHKNTEVYSGPAHNAKFTVPEGSEVCYFYFSAEAGTTISEAGLDGGAETIKLKYTLLPGFAANRLQGLWANQNAIQRTVFFEDGMKMFAQSPILGNGLGSFETGATSVQEFFYESRYIHNHYIQVLLEAGVPGLIFYLGSLLSLCWLLWKRRKEEDGLGWSCPALWACMAMLAAHSVVEVSLSIIVIQCYAFVIYGLIVAVCPEKKAVAEAVEEAPAPETKGKKKKQQKVEVPKKDPREYWAKGACIALASVFLVTLGMNLVAKKITSSGANGPVAFLEKLEQAAELDPYEYNDAKLSYVNIVLDYDVQSHIPMANQMAAEMESVQSNSIPQNLVNYYLRTGQYEAAFRAANLATKYSATNPASWNAVIARFWTNLMASEEAPLKGEHSEMLIQGVMDYYETLQEHNRDSMEAIELDPVSKQFFTELFNIAEEPEKHDELACMLIFRSWLCCDADEDGIPDQMTKLEKADVREKGAVALQADGYVDIECYAGSTNAVRITIECEDPDAVVVTDIAINEILPVFDKGDGYVTYLPLNGGSGIGTEGFRIGSVSAQTLEKIEISTHF